MSSARRRRCIGGELIDPVWKVGIHPRRDNGRRLLSSAVVIGRAPRPTMRGSHIVVYVRRRTTAVILHRAGRPRLRACPLLRDKGLTGEEGVGSISQPELKCFRKIDERCCFRFFSPTRSFLHIWHLALEKMRVERKAKNGS